VVPGDASPHFSSRGDRSGQLNAERFTWEELRLVDGHELGAAEGLLAKRATQLRQPLQRERGSARAVVRHNGIYCIARVDSALDDGDTATGGFGVPDALKQARGLARELRPGQRRASASTMRPGPALTQSHAVRRRQCGWHAGDSLLTMGPGVETRRGRSCRGQPEASAASGATGKGSKQTAIRT
jgi:hypothetical protein